MKRPKWAVKILSGIPKGHGCMPESHETCVFVDIDDCMLFNVYRHQQRKNPRKLKACRDFCKAMGWEG